MLLVTESFFKDYSDYIVGIPTFIISTLAAYYFYRKLTNKKELSYSIRNAIKIVDISSIYKNRFAISFDNKPINDLSLLTIEFFNSGNQPITKGDFENDIQIELKQSINKNIYVLSTDITDRKPANISNTLSSNGTRLSISPSLLNPKDSFKLQILVDFEDVSDISINVNSRISGISELRRVDSQEEVLSVRIVTKSWFTFVIAALLAILSSNSAFDAIKEIISRVFK